MSTNLSNLPNLSIQNYGTGGLIGSLNLEFELLLLEIYNFSTSLLLLINYNGLLCIHTLNRPFIFWL